MRKNVFAVVVLFLFLALPVIASEQHEHLLPLQGTIQANGGDLGRGDLIITIWDAPTAGNLVYNSTTDFYNVVSAGDYDILLGNGSQPLSLVFGKRYYMDVLINRTDVDFNGSERQLFMSNVGNITMTTPLATNSTDVDSALNISRGGAYINGNVSVNETINITAANGDIVTAGRFTTESTDVDDALNLTAGGLTVAGNIDQAFRVNNTGDVRVRSADTDDALNVSNGAAFLTAGNSGTVNIGRTGWNVDNNGDLSTNSDDANAGGTISVLSREPVVFTVNNGFNITNTPTVQTNGSIELRSGNGLQAFDDVSISWGTGAGPPDFSSVWSSTNNRLEFQAPLGALGPTINFHASPVLFDDFFNITITDSTLRTNGTVYVTNPDVDDAMNISGGAIFRAASGNALLTVGNQNTGVIINQGGTIAVGNGDSTAANHVDIYAGGTNACAYITLYEEDGTPQYLFVQAGNLRIHTAAPASCDEGVTVGSQ